MSSGCGDARGLTLPDGAQATDRDPVHTPSMRRYRSVLLLGDSMVGYKHGLDESRPRHDFTTTGRSSRRTRGTASGSSGSRTTGGSLSSCGRPTRTWCSCRSVRTTCSFRTPKRWRRNSSRWIVRTIGARDCAWMGPPDVEGRHRRRRRDPRERRPVRLLRREPDAAFRAESTTASTFTDMGGEQWAEAFLAFFPRRDWATPAQRPTGRDDVELLQQSE